MSQSLIPPECSYVFMSMALKGKGGLLMNCRRSRTDHFSSQKASQQQAETSQPMSPKKSNLSPRTSHCKKALPKVQKGLEVCYCLWECHPDPRLGPILGLSRSHPASEGVPSRFAMCFALQRFGPIQVRRWGAFRPFLVPSCSRAERSSQGQAWTGQNRLLGFFRILSIT